ncbi:hypothetical protein ES288_A11G248200v1 [Gossypium darwinii]|uniref:Uncharacterized protein n=1 Tax=Gossypium darwinii TaxID=34276 RepID=A0A5D2ENF1_GOSDA|nr:hypothetical protein ES288_A11G248200v1 [Gossypium darwinii]
MSCRFRVTMRLFETDVQMPIFANCYCSGMFFFLRRCTIQQSLPTHIP